MSRVSTRAVLLVAAEGVLIMTAIAVAAYVRLGDWMWTIMTEEYGIPKALLLAAVCQICLYYADLYEVRRVSDRGELLVRIVQALGGASFILAAVYFWFPVTMIGRGVFLIAAVLIAVLIVGWRVAFDWLSRQVGPTERLLLIGTSPAAVSLARELYESRQALGVEIVGFVDPDPARVGAPVLNPGVIGTVEDIPAIVRTHAVDRVVVSLGDARGKLPMDKLLEMRLDGVRFDHLASVYEQYTGKIAVENLRPSWLIFSSGFAQARIVHAAKRAVDFVAASLGLLLLSPVLLIIALLVKATSRGPALYHQARVGQHGRIFNVHKFRSMCKDAEAATGPVWASSNDARVTAFGLFMRRTRLDELPQLWNVLIGEMSLVGPRPERPEFVQELTEAIPFYSLRHAVRPGVTGWAQVRYTYGANVEDALQKLQYDLYYIKHLSIRFDLTILLSTVKIVLLARGSR
jgi:sugar transferase (PEP-CTERM system associated)